MAQPLAGRDLLSVADLTEQEIISILDAAESAKRGGSVGAPLAGRHIVLVFQRPSNRTRVSFEVAVDRLGGHPISLQLSLIHI